MFKWLLIIFILIPISIWFGKMVATLASMLLMVVAIFIGGFAHSLFKGKSTSKWNPPLYLTAVQYLIIYGFIYSVYANVIGSTFSLEWLLSIGKSSRGIFSIILALDLVYITVLATDRKSVV